MPCQKEEDGKEGVSREEELQCGRRRGQWSLRVPEVKLTRLTSTGEREGKGPLGGGERQRLRETNLGGVASAELVAAHRDCCGGERLGSALREPNKIVWDLHSLKSQWV